MDTDTCHVGRGFLSSSVFPKTAQGKQGWAFYVD